MTIKPFPYQQEGINFLRSRKRCLLADEQGLGKTAQVLWALSDRGLIVCPKGLKNTWADECKKFRPDLKPIILSTRAAGLKYPQAGELVITNLEILPDWLEPPPTRSGFSASDKSQKAKLARKKLAAERKAYKSRIAAEAEGYMRVTLVCDEAQKAKNVKSIRARKFAWLSKMCARTWMLSATPMERGFALDLWGILRAAHMEKEVFESWPNFLKVMNGKKTLFGGWSFGLPSSEAHQCVKPHMLRRLKKDVKPDLPDKIHSWITVPLSKTDSQALNAVQFEGRKVEFTKMAKVRAAIAKSRIPPMLEFVESFEETGTKLVVWSAHRAPVDELGKRQGWAIITGDVSSEARQEIVRNQHKYKGIAITISAGSTGLTLTGFSHQLFVDLAWNVNDNNQAEDRLHRIGQEETVNIYRMRSDNEFERNLNKKLAMASENIDIVIEGN